MVEVNAVAGVTDLEREHFHTGDIHLAGLGGIAGVHDAAGPEALAVADDVKLDAGGGVSIHFVIHAHAGGEGLGAAVEVDIENAFGVGAQTAIVTLPRDGQRVAFDRLVGVGCAPALRDGADIQLVEPDGFGGKDAGGEKGQDAAQGDGRARMHGMILPHEKSASSSPVRLFVW